MPDNQQTWLSVEQREAMDSFSIRRSWDLLYASHAAADRLLAELREQLAAKDAEIATVEGQRKAVSDLASDLQDDVAKYYRENERLRAALEKANELIMEESACWCRDGSSTKCETCSVSEQIAEALAATPPAKPAEPQK